MVSQILFTDIEVNSQNKIIMKPRKLADEIERAMQSSRWNSTDDSIVIGRVEEFNVDEILSEGKLYIQDGIIYLSKPTTNVHVKIANDIVMVFATTLNSFFRQQVWFNECGYCYGIWCKYTCGICHWKIPDGILGKELTDESESKLTLKPDFSSIMVVEVAYSNESPNSVVMEALNYLNEYGLFLYALAVKLYSGGNNFCIDILLLKRQGTVNLANATKLEWHLERLKNGDELTFEPCHRRRKLPSFDTKNWSRFGTKLIHRVRVTDDNIEEDLEIELDAEDFGGRAGEKIKFVIPSSVLKLWREMWIKERERKEQLRLEEQQQ